MTPPPDLDDATIARLARAPRRALLFDIDGTLARIVARPDLARVDAPVRDRLATLAAAPGTLVALVTGRAIDDARRVVDVPGAWYVGNHGAERRAPDGAVVIDEQVAAHADALNAAAGELAEQLASIDGASVEDKRLSISVHYRSVARDRVPELEALVRRVAEVRGLEHRPAKEVVEVRAPVAVDKGTAVMALLRSQGWDFARAPVLFAGDDTTDEDAFRSLNAIAPDAVTIRIGRDVMTTDARYRLSDPAAVASLIDRLSGA